MTGTKVNETASTPEIGERMPEGTIFAGCYEGKPLYTMPADAATRRWLFPNKTTYTFNQAGRYAGKLNACGHRDWRVPNEGELAMLYQNHNKGKLKGTFNETGVVGSGGWYWSSRVGFGEAVMGQEFRYGIREYELYKDFELSLRCVRG
jgi:hypothetical protein